MIARKGLSILPLVRFSIYLRIFYIIRGKHENFAQNEARLPGLKENKDQYRDCLHRYFKIIRFGSLSNFPK